MAELAMDGQGNPVLLAVPGVDIPNTRSGNPAHVPKGQPGGGRFGTRGASGQEDPTQPPAGVGPEEWARRRDAVREAAREFENFASQDVKDWLRGRITRAFSEGEVEAFLRDVRSQQIEDLVDILDNSERGGMRSRRLVRVMAPKGYTRKTLNGLNDDELRSLVARLRSRGWGDKQVAGLAKRLPEAKATVIDSLEDRDQVGLDPQLHKAIRKIVQDNVEPPTISHVERDDRGLIDTISLENGKVLTVKRDENGLLEGLAEI